VAKFIIDERGQLWRQAPRSIKGVYNHSQAERIAQLDFTLRPSDAYLEMGLSPMRTLRF